MAEEEVVDRETMLVPKGGGSGRQSTTPDNYKERPWAWPEAQDHCYIPNNDCDLFVNSTHDYYRRVGQSELLDDLEHSYAMQLPKIDSSESALLQEKEDPSRPNKSELLFESVSCRWGTCEFAAETKEQLNEHIASHIARGMRKCLWRNCSKKEHQYSARYLLKRHVASHIDWKPHDCPHCGRNFPTAERCRLHIRSVHEGEVKYKCEVCNEFFKTTSDRSHHMNRKHKKQRLKCSGCDKLYAGHYELRRHGSVCKGKKRESGETCDAVIYLY